MKKKLLIILLAIFMTGCTAEYKITIKDGKVNETLTVIEENKNNLNIKDEAGRTFEDYAKIYGKTYDLTTSFYDLYSDKSCEDGCSYYTKEYINEDGKIGFRLTHEFELDEYNDSAIANEHFPGFQVDINENIVTIVGGSSWNFINNFKNFDELKITIESDNKIVSSNGIKKNSEYTWKVHKGNTDGLNKLYMILDTNLKEEVNKNNSIWYFIIILILINVGLISYLMYKKRVEQNSI